MPVEFLTDEQAARYGQYQGDPTPEQLTRSFYLSEHDHAFLAQRRRPHNKLGCALQLCTLRFLGTFQQDPTAVPAVVVQHLAEQLNLHADVLPKYLKREPTRFKHQQLILVHLGYQPFDERQAFRLIRWLYAQVATSSVRPSVLFDLTTAHLVARQVVLPGVTTLARLIARIRERLARQTYGGLAGRLTAGQRATLDSLLVLREGERLTSLEVLRTGPTRITAPALLAAVQRVEQIRLLGIGHIDLKDVPEARRTQLARHAGGAWAQTLSRMGEERRHATLLVFVQHLERTATDDVLDVFDALMTTLALRGEARRRRERLRSLRDLDQAALTLQDAVRVLLDDTVPAGEVRQRVLTRLGEGTLRDAVATVQTLASPDTDPLAEALSGSYATVRRFLPALLQTVTLEGTTSARPLLDAWRFLKAQEQHGRGRPKWSQAPRSFVPVSWERRVFPTVGEVNRAAYTLCVLHQLHQALKRREVFAPVSERYRDPRAELLQGSAWTEARADVARALGRSLDPQAELDVRRLALNAAYQEVTSHLGQNGALQVETQEGQTLLRLSPLDPQPDPPSLTRLQRDLAAHLPMVDLPALLLELHEVTGFAHAFTHLTDGHASGRDLQLSVCAVLLAQACNIGLKAVARPERPALTLSRLSWVQQNHIRAETITAANACLVNAQLTLPLAQRWGGGEVASADGLRFVVPVRSAHTGWNSKYFGSQRGVTYYNFTSDQFTGFHGIVVPGTLRDSLFILAGLLEQQTRLDPREIMADTHGSSDVVFGLFSLLGYQFSPRLADVGDQRFWRMERDADYGALNDLSRHTINERLIAEHWDDLLRLAGSLKLGKVQATAVMRTLQRGGSLSGLGRAVAELGRIEKTLYLLNYVQDEAYRRRILVQLNRGEGRHRVARRVFHGHKGEVRQRYREGMEDQLGALGLVVNAIVLWNTRYLGAALAASREPAAPEDVARLSPLLFEHVNMLGTYDFTLPGELAGGRLRPLRDPDSLEARLSDLVEA
ncbi:Tn3 family transposase [Deinococcus sp. PESE-13]